MNIKLAIALTICGMIMASGCQKKTGYSETQYATPSDAVISNEKLHESEPHILPSSPIETATLIDYKTISIRREKIEDPSEEEVGARLQEFLDNHATFITDRGIQAGDYVSISYYAEVGNTRIGNGNETEFEYGKEDSIREEFAEVLAGAKQGEVRKAVITYPANYGVQELNGNTVTYNIIVNSIKEKPTLTDELVRSYSKAGATDIESFKQEIKNELMEEWKEQDRFEAAYELLDKIINESEFHVPDDYLNAMYLDYDESLRKWLKENTMTEEEYRSYYNLSEEDMEKERNDTVMENAKYLIVANKILKEEGLAADIAAVKEYWKYAYGSEITDETLNGLFIGQELEEIKITATLMNYLREIVRVEYNDPA